MSAKHPKAKKVARKANKKTPPPMKTKKPAIIKPEKAPVVVEEVDGDLDDELPEEEAEAVEPEIEINSEPKTRLDMLRYRHHVMKKEIDQIRVALEEDPDD